MLLPPGDRSPAVAASLPPQDVVFVLALGEFPQPPGVGDLSGDPHD